MRNDLIARLRGCYTVPVNDGAGTLNGSTTFTRMFDVPPINLEAADEIERLSAALTAQGEIAPAPVDEPYAHRLRDGLEAIEILLTEELRERYGANEQAPKGVRVFSLLVVPRNIARNALADADKLRAASPVPAAEGLDVETLASLADRCGLLANAPETSYWPTQDPNQTTGNILTIRAFLREVQAALRAVAEARR